MSLLHQIALTKINGVGPVLARNLLSHFENVESIFAADGKALKSIPGIGTHLIQAILSSEPLAQAEKEIEFIEKHRITPLFFTADDYPQRLKNCFDAPILLYYKGDADLNINRVISMVGTRAATSYGKSICEELIAELSPYQPLIVSGLAHGIDTLSHKNALKHQIPTVGVLGHGLDRIYPAANRDLAAKMLATGGLLTEFPSGTKPDKPNFPMRNRIIAGLSDVTIVVEAAIRGGALITAEIANNYNRDVCAFPGAIRQEFSAGCNHLIKTHRAHLIQSAEDLAYLLNWETEKPAATPQQLQMHIKLSAEEQRVYDLIENASQLGIDALSTKLGYPQSKLAILLLQLEMKSAIVSLPGKIYRLT